jgi:putative ABC transport system permease protein
MSAIPFAYNVESVRARWASTIVAVLGIAGTVAVFVAMLAMARGFQATLATSGTPENVIVRRAGATSEMDSVVPLTQLRPIEDAAEVARKGPSPLVSAEVVVVGALPLKATGTDANVQIRGVSARALDVRPHVRVSQGRFFSPGLPEIVVGKNAITTYTGLDLGASVKFGGLTWTVVGVLDSGGSAFDSELWADADMVNQAYQRPKGLFQSATARLVSAEALGPFKKTLEADPRLTVQVESEVEYYAKASRMITNLILGLGTLVAIVMGVGAVFGALNTMYSAVSERSREVATLRAIGFGEGAVVLSFLAEALVIALVGGLLGCLFVLPINGLTTGTMNWQTFSHLAFAFRVTPGLLATGVAFALVMGLVGGVPPAIRAARLPVAAALRDL